MYKVSSEQKQYNTYTLSDDSSGSQIEVVPERGGIGKSLVKRFSIWIQSALPILI
jgi:hypothetical protein